MCQHHGKLRVCLRLPSWLQVGLVETRLLSQSETSILTNQMSLVLTIPTSDTTPDGTAARTWTSAAAGRLRVSTGPPASTHWGRTSACAGPGTRRSAVFARMLTSVSRTAGSTGLFVVSTLSVRTIPGPTDVSVNQGLNTPASPAWTSMSVWRSPTFAATTASTCGDHTDVTVVMDTNCLQTAGHV